KLNGYVLPSVLDIAQKCIKAVRNQPVIPGVFHGDFCFSNILYDSRGDRIKVLDPRGVSGSNESIYGDLRYDIAKLSHSVIGMYDHIIAERIDFIVHDDYHMDLQFHESTREKDIQE